METEHSPSLDTTDRSIFTMSDHEGETTSPSSDRDRPRSSSNSPNQPIAEPLSVMVETIAGWRETSWSMFVNKSADEMREYAIEIFVGEPKPTLELELGETSDDKTSIMVGETTDSVNHPNEPSFPPSLPEGHSAVPDRIRINCPQILRTLASLDKNIDATYPLVMLRPFKFLVEFEDTIRGMVSQSQDPPVDTARSWTNEPTRHVTSVFSNPAQHDGRASHDYDFRHMQCLLHFFDHYVKPTILRLNSDTAKRICFRDLWYILQPGEDIFMPLENRRHISLGLDTVTPEMFQSRYQKLWRITGTGGGRPNLEATEDRSSWIKQTPFKINCYYIDYDGIYFCPTIHTFSIPPFCGERDITSLDFYPIRLLEQGQQPWAKNAQQCRMVFNALIRSHDHFHYHGPTVVTQPCGCPLEDSMLHPDHIESEVIVDYKTTLFKHPSWRPEPSVWKNPPSFPDEIRGKSRLRYWEDQTRSKLVRVESEQVHDDSLIDSERAHRFRDRVRIFDVVPNGWLSNEQSVPEDDLAMLSPRVFVFVLRTRAFAPVWLWGLQKVSPHMDGLHNLQLRDNTFKDIIYALVRTHFLQANTARNLGMESDTARGKGRGLIFLLHRVPGGGKTFTAESIAAATGRPLFQIACGDLGLTAVDVENALRDIFRYAQLWNCVLLLDECDIFLTQRTRADLKRNSMVSVFLQVLEWYSGVLFLTTNRVGTLDSAVHSRITWSTYYPPLNMNQTREIWKVNLKSLEKRAPDVEVDKKGILKFAKAHFLSHVEHESHWNGRQIQNAFKVAVSLAEWETLTHEQQLAVETTVPGCSTDRRLKVTAAHFEKFAVAAKKFDQYMYDTTGLTEAQRAYNAMERADNYVEEDEQHVPHLVGDTLPEPVSKKRRTSSMTSGSPPWSSDGRFKQTPASSSPVGLSSSSTRIHSVRQSTSSQKIAWPQSKARLHKGGGSIPGSLGSFSRSTGSSGRKRKRATISPSTSRRPGLEHVDQDNKGPSSALYMVVSSNDYEDTSDDTQDEDWD